MPTQLRTSLMSGPTPWREDEVPDFFPNASDESQLFDFVFLVSPLSCTFAMAFNLCRSLRTISGVPAKALSCFRASIDLSVPLRSIGHDTSM